MTSPGRESRTALAFAGRSRSTGIQRSAHFSGLGPMTIARIPHSARAETTPATSAQVGGRGSTNGVVGSGSGLGASTVGERDGRGRWAHDAPRLQDGDAQRKDDDGKTHHHGIDRSTATEPGRLELDALRRAPTHPASGTTRPSASIVAWRRRSALSSAPGTWSRAW